MSTVLDAYLKRKETSDAEFAPLIGRDRSMVSKLRRGLVRPTLDLADVIEKVTGGEVPIRAWLDDPEPAPAEQAAAA